MIKRLSAAGCLIVVSAFGQPSFDTTSIRVLVPGNAPNLGVLFDSSKQVAALKAGEPLVDGVLTLRYVPMRTLLRLAYSEILGNDYLKSRADWLDSVYYDLTAKAPLGTSAENVRLMMQSLLVDRFQIAVHREQKTLSVLTLVQTKGGAKLQPSRGSRDPECRIDEGAVRGKRYLSCHNATLSFLADHLRLEGRPVVNLTALPGHYDVQVEWAVLDTPEREIGGGPRSSAGKEFEIESRLELSRTLEKELGLRLEDRKQPMPVIVIDHLSSVPSGD